MRMNELFDKYEAESIPELEPRTQRDYRGILGKLRAQFGEMDVTAVKPRHVADFINVKKGRIHRNRMVTILSTVFKIAMGSWAIDLDLVNPCTVVKRWPTKPRDRYVTDQEFAAVRALASPQLQIAMDLALLTGQRQGDIVGLTWKQVHAIGVPRAKWYIEIRQGKTGKYLGIMISPAIETVLKRARMMKPEWPRKYVIRSTPRYGKQGERYSPDGFRAMWQRTINAYVRSGGSRYSFHDIRAKSISDNASLESAYLLAGHIDQKMTRRVYDRNIRMVEPLR